MARLNTVHITVLEARGLPPAAAYLTAQCSGQKVKLANLDKGRGRGADEASMIQRNGAAICWHFPPPPHVDGGGRGTLGGHKQLLDFSSSHNLPTHSVHGSVFETALSLSPPRSPCPDSRPSFFPLPGPTAASQWSPGAPSSERSPRRPFGSPSTTTASPRPTQGGKEGGGWGGGGGRGTSVPVCIPAGLVSLSMPLSIIAHVLQSLENPHIL